MSYDTRDFIEDLKKAGELVEINDEVDWNYEISAFEVMSARVGGPAILFNNIKGNKEGKVLVGHFAGTFRKPHRRIAVALGMDPNTDFLDFVQGFNKRAENYLKPVEVASGQCKEVVKMGKEVNLLEWPFTYHAIGDAGRYIFSNSSIVKDPDSDWTNVGCYSIEVYSKNRLVITPYPHSNWVQIYTTKYEMRNESMPIAIALGGDPAFLLCAGIMAPPGVSESDLAGGLRGKPMEFIKAETSDLLVPANAEMIIEGEVRPYERLPEGPKIEAFGFSVGPRQPRYAIRVHCITHRKNPILPDVHCTPAGSTDCWQKCCMGQGHSMIQRRMGMPISHNFRMHAISGGHMQAFALKDGPEPYKGFKQDMFELAWGIPAFSSPTAHIWTDADVDLTDYEEIVEVIHTKTNPAKDWILLPAAHMQHVLPSSWMEEEDRSRYFTAASMRAPKLIIDATTKEEPPLGIKRTRFETLYPEELQKWVVDNWQRLGFSEETVWKKKGKEASF